MRKLSLISNIVVLRSEFYRVKRECSAYHRDLNGVLTLRDDRMTGIFAGGANIYTELSAALEVISAVYEQVRPRTENQPASAQKQLADRVRSYIERNYADSIKIADIAAENFVSVGYLTHVFTAETGVPPREYLSHIRCARAYELIRHTAMKFADISAAAGFCCANDMSRKIREYYGKTPTEIRRNVFFANQGLSRLAKSK